MNQPDPDQTDSTNRAQNGAPDQATGDSHAAVGATESARPDAAQGQPSNAGPAAEDAGSDALRDPRRRKRNRRRGRRGDKGGQAPGLALEGADLAEGAFAEAPAAAGRFTDDQADAPPTLEKSDLSEVFGAVMSGAFDEAVDGEDASGTRGPVAEDGEPVDAAAQEAAVPAKQAPARRVLAPESDAPKLHKVLAQSGVGSRRDLEQMIAEGRVTVNGQAAHTGQRISYGDKIAVNGKPVKVRIAPLPARVIAYHKPAGEVVTHDDPQQRPTVFRRLPRLPQGKWQSVGRLDINTEGLLLFTNSGDLANRLMHPRFGVEREYAVRILGSLSDENRTKLLEGVEVDGQVAAFKSIEDGGGDGANRWVRVVITEGRNREVRKLFDSVGHAVSRLIRIRYGSVVLPKGLRRGVWVDLPTEDVKVLRSMTSSGVQAAGSVGPKPARAGAAAAGPRGRKNARRGRQREAGSLSLPPGLSETVSGEAGDTENFARIPNPLQQTYDKRAIQQARRARDIDEDGPIPNPLLQTYDRRAVQAEARPRRELDEDGPIPNPLQQTYDKRFVKAVKSGSGGGAGRSGRKQTGGKVQAAGGQPDPMRTSVGYIGADAFHQKGKSGRSGKGGRRR
ncbi:MAG: pseudouridine synthase [Betaproteobacteria bacterium]